VRFFDLLSSPFRLGSAKRYDQDTNRRIVVINSLALIGIVLTFSFGLNSIFTSSLWMGAVLLAICLTLLVARSLLDMGRPPNEQVLPSSLLIVSLFALMLLLIVTGGRENTGTMWIYILPPVVFFFAGLKVGMVIITLFIFIISVLMFYPDDTLLLTTYTLGYKVRFIVSFLTTILFATIYEYSRMKNIEKFTKMNDELKHLAMHDSLTGLANRRFAQNQLERESARAKRSDSVVCVVLCDIDKFKVINDTYGHDCGDEVLKFISEIMSSTIREQDLVARWGGEEFIFILPNTPSSDGANLAEQIRKKIQERPLNYDNTVIHITASFGVSVLDKNTEIKQALTQTDDAMYIAKRNGRNQVVAFDYPTIIR
jgi:diguanylate cyclase (GGDEF)-like protein